MRNRFTIFALALMLAVQAASPCLALCTASAKQAAAQPAAVPHCHGAQSGPAAPADASKAAIKNPLPGCCCINEAGAKTTGEPVPVTLSTSQSLQLFLSLDLTCPLVRPAHAAGLSAPGEDASPPGAPLFITHRALLI